MRSLPTSPLSASQAKSLAQTHRASQLYTAPRPPALAPPTTAARFSPSCSTAFSHPSRPRPFHPSSFPPCPTSRPILKCSTRSPRPTSSSPPSPSSSSRRRTRPSRSVAPSPSPSRAALSRATSRASLESRGSSGTSGRSRLFTQRSGPCSGGRARRFSLPLARNRTRKRASFSSLALSRLLASCLRYSDGWCLAAYMPFNYPHTSFRLDLLST